MVWDSLPCDVQAAKQDNIIARKPQFKKKEDNIIAQLPESNKQKKTNMPQLFLDHSMVLC